MKLSNDALRKRLVELGQEVDSLTGRLTNCGGCCVYAAIVAERLRKLGVQCHGIVMDYGHLDLDENRPSNPYDITEWVDNGVRFVHVALEVTFPDEDDRYIYDSNTLIKFNDYRGYKVADGYLSLEEMSALGGNRIGWNPSFPRSRIPAIERLADKILLDIDCPVAEWLIQSNAGARALDELIVASFRKTMDNHIARYKPVQSLSEELAA